MGKNTNTSTAKVDENKVVNTVEKNSKAVMLPLDPLNEKDTKLKVTINGRDTVIVRGKSVKVSDNVYEALQNAGIIK